MGLVRERITLFFSKSMSLGKDVVHGHRIIFRSGATWCYMAVVKMAGFSKIKVYYLSTEAIQTVPVLCSSTIGNVR